MNNEQYSLPPLPEIPNAALLKKANPVDLPPPPPAGIPATKNPKPFNLTPLPPLPPLPNLKTVKKDTPSNNLTSPIDVQQNQNFQPTILPTRPLPGLALNVDELNTEKTSETQYSSSIEKENGLDSVDNPMKKTSKLSVLTFVLSFFIGFGAVILGTFSLLYNTKHSMKGNVITWIGIIIGTFNGLIGYLLLYILINLGAIVIGS